MNKETQAAILRAAGRFIDKRISWIEPRVKALEDRPTPETPDLNVIVREIRDAMEEDVVPSLVKKAVDALPKPKDGEDGKSVTLEEVMKALMPELGKAFAAIPIPANGKDGKDGLPGADGRNLTVDDVLPVLKSMQAEWALDFERRAQGLFQKAVDAIPVPKDGKDGKDGTNGIGWDDMQVEHDGKRTVTLKFVKGDVQRVEAIVFPCTIDAGFFKEGQTYEEGDGVTFGGSYWIAQKSTTVKPEVGSEDWRLAVRKGRDGKRD